MIFWDNTKDNPLEELKMSPIAMILHKSRLFREILDLSFALRPKNSELLPSVNKSSVKTAPQGNINQLEHPLMRTIHAFTQADEDMKKIMAKWDIQYGFWRLNCALGEEWNFAYVLPQA